ncbi:MAG: hypothetical protein ACRD2A_23715 [Vicinamibacterales bacterium]
MRFAVGAKGLQELFYFADVYPPDDALRRALVDELADDPLAVAIERAHRLAKVPTDSFAHTKRLLREQALNRIVEESPRLDAIAKQIWSRDDIRETITGYFALATGRG